ncbi:type 1 glutamine amidotransferase [Chachezhania antarctica]|uniref:type 1 glutamine amidotransferase n=1 Tax=Chachezhania antarctica TaxID=2340860 RepID=UPI000EB4E9CD|nr:type 1 glutamine amidotransferase [Chachezhania antarctica]|tara:strand:- start:246 stop:926 length:681 start_codon:yes stop_codon:yes gene_type:complete
MKIGILQTGHAPDLVLEKNGDYDAMFRRLLDGHGFEFVTYNVVDNEFPDGAEAADGWLVTGSRHGAYEDHDWIPPLEELIREIKAKDRPMVGVCFGHQIIAQALGGKVEKFAGGWAVGRKEYRIGDQIMALNAWHQDQVVELPEGATVEGHSDFTANAIVSYGPNVWTVQPHPEFQSDVIEALIHGRGKGVVPDDLLAEAEETLVQPNDNASIALKMAKVLKGERS